MARVKVSRPIRVTVDGVTVTVTDAVAREVYDAIAFGTPSTLVEHRPSGWVVRLDRFLHLDGETAAELLVLLAGIFGEREPETDPWSE